MVLDGCACNPGDLSWAPLEVLGELAVFDSTDAERAAERAAGAAAVFTGRTPLSEETVARLPELRFIGTLGTGFNMIDLGACRARHIAVCNVPEYSTASVAQHVFALLLAYTNRPAEADGAARAGFWTGLPLPGSLRHYTTGLAGMTLGVVGYGSIGRKVARIAEAFGMQVLATSRSRQSGGEDGVRFAALPELLRLSDAVSLNCPLNESTRGLINAGTLALMKPGAVLINTARGAVVDEEALARALNGGALAFAATDVLSDEPFAGKSPLFTAKNCLITPHIAWTAKDARARLIDTAAGNLRAFLRGGAANRVV